MADQDARGSNAAPTSTRTDRMQTTRFQYPRGDEVIGDFFTTNLYKSAALIDVIYLFRLDYGADADVSQILRTKLMAARAQHDDGAASPATFTAADAGDADAADTVADGDVDDSADNTANDAAPANERSADKTDKTASRRNATKRSDAAESDAAQSGIEQSDTAQSDTEQSSTAKSGEFNIAEMFD